MKFWIFHPRRGCEVLDLSSKVRVRSFGFPIQGEGVKFEFWWGVKFGGETVVAPCWVCETLFHQVCGNWW